MMVVECDDPRAASIRLETSCGTALETSNRCLRRQIYIGWVAFMVALR